MLSKYIILYNILKKNIISDIEKGIDHLPAERELCKIYNVSRQTVRNALALLEEENIIKRIHGSGAYITGIIPGVLSNKLVLIITNDSEYLYPSFISRIKSKFFELGYDIDVRITNNDSSVERSILTELVEDSPRGVIIEPTCSTLPTPNFDLFNALNSKKIPIIFINGFYPNLPDCIYIKSDDFAGGNILGNFLLSGSHRKIAAIFQMDTQSGHERYLGLYRSMIDSGVSFSNEDVFWFNSYDLNKLRKKNDTRFLVNMINKKLMPYSAIVCQNDEIAYWLIKELELSKISVPSDISIVSFDNSYLSTLSKHRITSMDYNSESIEGTVAEKMVSMISGHSERPFLLPWKLIPGESSVAIG